MSYELVLGSHRFMNFGDETPEISRVEFGPAMAAKSRPIEGREIRSGKVSNCLLFHATADSSIEHDRIHSHFFRDSYCIATGQILLNALVATGCSCGLMTCYYPRFRTTNIPDRLPEVIVSCRHFG